MPESNSNAIASAIQPGSAPSSVSRTSPRPGASSTTSAATTSATTTHSARLASLRGSNSPGISTRVPGGSGRYSTVKRYPAFSAPPRLGGRAVLEAQLERVELAAHLEDRLEHRRLVVL